MSLGSDIVSLAMGHEGERYILGQPVPLGNPNWRGPWDCAEFVSWAAYHAYRLVFAVRPSDINRGESYSGWWYSDAMALGANIPVGRAIATPGAILVRQPGAFGIRIGHVAISRGDGTTIEAHSARVGVAVREAHGRQWSIGVALPGVDYVTGTGGQAYRQPTGLLKLKSPYMRGQIVRKVQQALVGAGTDPGPVDGVYGSMTHMAVAGFQAREGLRVDGVVGEETARALGLTWPLTA